MIDILIPAYNAHETILDTLFSLAYQNIANKLNIYIINDGSNNSYNDFILFFKKYFNTIQELTLDKNKGPGYARNYGINNSNSKYIIFIDSDDIISSPFAINNLYNKIEDDNSDVVISKIMDETDYGLFKLDYSIEYLHGKIYRRSFILDNNIKFSNTKFAEDIAFNKSIFLQESNVSYLDEVTYIWKNNKDSITRRDGNSIVYKYIYEYIYNNLYAIKVSLKGKPNINKISINIYETIVYFYLCYISYNDINDFKDNFKIISKLIDLSVKYPINDYDKNIIMKNKINEFSDEWNIDIFKLINSNISFNNFIKEVKND